jgi:predicted nucleic acid-binding protein
MPTIPRIYLDTCALIRLFDEGSQPRVRAESQAVEEFFALVFQDTVRWIVSEVLEAEILNNHYSEERPEVLELLAFSAERIVLTDEAIQRADDLEKLGYETFDALHLASAEQARVDSLLTTDDRFMRRVRRGLGQSVLSNPKMSLKEAKGWRSGFCPFGF